MLAYVNFYMDRSKPKALLKVILNFYSANKISEAKKLLVSTFHAHVDHYPLKAKRRKSSMRSAHLAEVEDILGILNALDTIAALAGAEFSVAALDRLPGIYSPEEVHPYTVIDRQSGVDAVLLCTLMTLLCLHQRLQLYA